MEQDKNFRFIIPPVVLLTSIMGSAMLDLSSRKALFSIMNGREADVTKIIAIVVGGSTAIIAVGFVITSISIFLLYYWPLVYNFFSKKIPLRCCQISVWLLLSLVELMKQKKPSLLAAIKVIGRFETFLNKQKGLINKGIKNSYAISYEADIADNALEDLAKLTNTETQDFKKERFNLVALNSHWKLSTIAPDVHQWLLRRWEMFLISFHCCIALSIAYLFVYFSQPGHGRKEWWLLNTVLIFIMLHNAIVAKRVIKEMLEFLIKQLTHNPKFKDYFIPALDKKDKK